MRLPDVRIPSKGFTIVSPDRLSFRDDEHGAAVREAAGEDVGVSPRGDAHFLLQFGAAQREVAGGDFRPGPALSDRLERRRAERQHLGSFLWTSFCIIIGVGLFFIFGGTMVLKSAALSILQMLVTTLEVFLVTAPTTEISVNPWMLLLLMGFVLVYLPYQTARKLSSVL